MVYGGQECSDPELHSTENLNEQTLSSANIVYRISANIVDGLPEQHMLSFRL